MPGKSIFRLNFLQKGRGPNLDPLVYAADENNNAFHSNIKVENECITISDAEGRKKFSVHIRWNIEGYGYI
ncbi:MAG TPA: hypothetical protein VLM39_04655, partial [Ignavibacteriaceae bacterium]|nr:hypothetical protein [Ignavibacteriaceae bacterium]